MTNTENMPMPTELYQFKLAGVAAPYGCEARFDSEAACLAFMERIGGLLSPSTPQVAEVRHTDHSIPCPTCGFVIRQVERKPFVIEDDTAAAFAPPPDVGMMEEEIAWIVDRTILEQHPPGVGSLYKATGSDDLLSYHTGFNLTEIGKHIARAALSLLNSKRRGGV